MRAVGWVATAAMLCSLFSRHGVTAFNEARLAVVGELRLRTSQTGDSLLVRVEDEAGTALPDVRVEVLASAVGPCDGALEPVQTTGADGMACFRVEGASTSRAVLIASRQHYSEARLEVDLEQLGSPPEILVFPRLVDLERVEKHAVQLARVHAGLLQLNVQCGDRITTIYQSEARAAERLNVELPTSSFQETLGSCELVAQTGGRTSPAVPINIVVTPKLSVERIEVRRDRIVASIKATSGVGPLSVGLIEAADGLARRSANVRDGSAQLEFKKEDAGRTIVVRYLPINAGFPAGSSLTIRLPNAASYGLSRVWLSLPLFFFAVWLTKRFLDQGPGRHRPKLGAKDLSLAVHAPGPPLDSHLHGIVFDLDTHERVPGAQLELYRIEATQRVSLGHVQSEAEGMFRFPQPFDDQSHYAVVCTSEGFRTAEVRPDGPVMRVGLVTERRALLRALVRWARASGWWIKGSSKFPTPLEVSRRAEQEGATDVQAWAERVNSRVYGKPTEPIDASDEEEPPLFDALR